MGMKGLKILDLSKNRLKGDFEPVVFLGGGFQCEDSSDSSGRARDNMYHRQCNRDSECAPGKCLFAGGLEEVWMDDNLLSGTISPEIGRLHRTLRILDLSQNRIKGTIPATMGVLKQLVEVNLYFNHLVGTIPPELGLCVKIRFLHLGVNHLSGSIPASLGNLARLEQLDLSMNQFQGTVPSTLGVMTSPVRTAACDRPGGSCFGESMRNLVLHSKNYCTDGQLTNWQIMGFKQPCATGDPSPLYQCKSCENPYPSGGRSNTLASPAADCHAGLPPFPGAADMSPLAPAYNDYPWGPVMPFPVPVGGVGPSLRLMILSRCSRTPSVYSVPPPPTPAPPPPPSANPPPSSST
eukprot:CAMPEP_0179413942 /NCGR_PEP_ID=MMETSP0799-20121207/5382_1 /TAXON_ID=46947 /ORGANISM="Geminigera cryophila, Strain CCMP2564" /LENGTH=350 /DNA_ID=CAMNT_0021186477 /DNA_START=178 /DNA_END=1230 /DNA_ORIENTATION=-